MRFRRPDSLSGEVGMLRWWQIKAFEQIAPDREATGDLPNRLAIAIPRTRQAEHRGLTQSSQTATGGSSILDLAPSERA